MRRVFRYSLAGLVISALGLVVFGLIFISGPPRADSKYIAGQSDTADLENLNLGFSRDWIRPIYEPEFVQAAEADLDPDEMVMGVSFNGEAHAYPLRILDSREIVNDVVGGIPVLVTW